MPKPSQSASPQSGYLQKFLNIVERLGNRLPEPLTLFLILAAIVPPLSWLVAKIGWTVQHPATGETVAAVNLLTRDQMSRMITEAVHEFANFPPLGVVLVVMLGVGVAERSGFISVMLRAAVVNVPRQLLTAAVVFTGLMSHVAGDAGYVVLLPLGAVVYAGVGRHPLAGLCAAFAGVSCGFSANLVVTMSDSLLAGFTTSAAQLIQPDYTVFATGNLYFFASSVPVLTLVGWLVSDYIVEPRLGALPVRLETGETAPSLSRDERAGLWAAAAAIFLYAILLLVLTLPSNAVLRDQKGTLEPFFHSLSFLLALGFLLPGLAFGIAVRTIRSDRDCANMMAASMSDMSSYIVLAFVVAQFIAYFRWSNLGLLTALGSASGLNAIGVTGAPLLLGLMTLTAAIDLVMGSASAKWAVLAPVMVPMMMTLGYSPELTQAAYRIGDSVSNVITPLNPYIPIIIAFCRRYVPEMRLGTLIASMLPYAVSFFLVWAAMLVCWYFFGLPLGPSAPLFYTP